MTTTSESDLIAWLKLFWTGDEPLSYETISDGYFLNEVFKEIDPNATTNEQLTKCKSIIDHIKNWEILIKNIRVYYMVVLQQAFVIRLPSIITICYDQHSSRTHSEIDKTIFLILGAAVQCERKEYFIQDIINRLPDESIQHGLMEYIKQVTEGSDTVINCIQLDDLPASQLIKQFRDLSEQWEDSFIEDSKVVLTQNDSLQKQISDQKNQIQVLKNVGIDNGLVSFSSHSEKNTALELAECKAKLRKLQNELDYKTDMISDLRDDLEVQQQENTKLKESQMKLTNESRRLRLMQDELDSQKELILRMPTIEAENTKLKEKVNELEYYRVRCEELREDLAVIANENSNLMDKIENNKKIVERSATLEVEYRKANRKIEELEHTVTKYVSEISKLEYRLQTNQEQDNVYISHKSELENELKRLQEHSKDNLPSSAISDEVIEKANAKLLRLQVENRALTSRLSDIKGEESIELNKLKEKISELEEENERLLNKVSRLQDSNKKEIQQNMEVEESKQLVLREKDKLEMEIKAVQETKNRRIEELIQENENLSETIMIIRERSEKSNDARINELEKENSKLHLSINETNHKLSKTEFDLQRMTQKSVKLDSTLEKSHQDYLQLSKANADLDKEITNLKLFKSRLEELQDKFSTMEVEKLRLEALVSEYYQQLQLSTTASNDTLEENMKELAIENQRKTSQLLKKISELESEILKTKSENDKLVRHINKIESKLKSLEQELENSKNELANFSRMETKLKLTERNITDLEKEREELQTHNLKLEQDIKMFDKENRRLKNQVEVQSGSIETHQARINECETKIHLLEKNKFDKNEFDAIQATVVETEKRLADSEQKNRELFQQVKEEKRQCATLREELLNERIDSQNLKNQLQKLTDELESAGISEFEANEQKFKMLESKVNSTVGDTLRKKEEKIADLQSKLNSSMNRNKDLTIKLQEQTDKYHGLEQKYEEELAVMAVKNNKSPTSEKDASSFTQYLQYLKDDLVKLERHNAQLDSEKQYLNTQCSELKEKLTSIETKSAQQLETLQTKFNDLNNENMRLEIEKSTLRSQLDTLRNENGNLSHQITANEKILYTTVDELNLLKKTKDELEVQCSSLQKLNNQLSLDYEQVKNDLNIQKSITKSTANKLHASNDELMKYKKDAESLKHLRELLENEKNSLADGARQLISLREENRNLSEEKSDLVHNKSSLESELKSIRQENKLLKCEYDKEKDTNAQLRETIKRLEEKIRKLEQEIEKLEGRIDNLSNQNNHLIDKNQKLLLQMKSVLMQNQELITETLEKRETQHTQEVSLRERLNQLQRHKERLEEKIMEQYKALPSTKKNKGGRNKFLKKAKEMLKRRDSKSSIDQERKNSSDIPLRYQRSQSCGTILGRSESSKVYIVGDRSSDYQYDQTDTSEKDQSFSDSEESEVNCGAPTPKSKSSKLNNTDTYSSISTLSRVDRNGSIYSDNKLMPGSMPIYDRDENEKRKVEEERIQASASLKTEHAPVMTRQIVNMKTISKTSQRPQSTVPTSSAPRRQLPPTTVSVHGSTNGNVDSLVFGNIISKNTAHHIADDTSSISSSGMSVVVVPTKKSINTSQPGVPARITSLPVTDRVEEEIINPDIVHDITRSGNNDYPRILSYTASNQRPQSTVPASASSKAILQRMHKPTPKSLSSGSENRTRGRPQTPNAEIPRLSSSHNNNHTFDSFVDPPPNVNSSTMKLRPQSSLGALVNPYGSQTTRRQPPVSQRVESYNTKRYSNSIDESMGPCPIPPTRKESGKVRSNHDSGSNASDKSEKTNSKQKLYYEYGHV